MRAAWIDTYDTMVKKQHADSSSSDEGFTRCRVDCPICGCETVQYRLNPRLYWNTAVDLDRKPSAYQCLRAIAGIHPPLYDLWHCPECHFTSHNRSFPDPLKHVFIDKSIVRQELTEAARRNPAFRRVCEHLGADVVADRATFEQAIRLALLAIYFRLALIEILRQGHAALARDYLRLAWLWRDQTVLAPDAPVDDQRLSAVAADWPAMPRNEIEALEAACHAFAKALDETAVEEDVQETLSILQHVGCVKLQIGHTDEAGDWLRRALQLAVEQQQQLNRESRQAARPDAADAGERASLVTRTRRLANIIDDCRALLDRCGKASDAVDSRSSGGRSSPSRRKSWFSRS